MKTIMLVSLIVTVVTFLLIYFKEYSTFKEGLVISSIVGGGVFLVGFLGWLSQFPTVGVIMEVFWMIVIFTALAGLVMSVLVKVFSLTKKALPLFLLLFGILFVVWLSSNFTSNPRESRSNPMGDYIPVIESDRH